MKKIYDITIGEIVNECTNRDKYRKCEGCKFYEFCSDLANIAEEFYEYFRYIENMEIKE